MDGNCSTAVHGRRSRVDDHIVILLLHKDVVEFVHEDELGDAGHIRKVLRLDLHFEESEESCEDVLIPAIETPCLLCQVRLVGIEMIADQLRLVTEVYIKNI